MSKLSYCQILRLLKNISVPHCTSKRNNYQQIGNQYHIPVLKNEVIEMLNPVDNGVYIDMTFGAGGHSESIMTAAKDIQLYVLDRDPTAFEMAKQFAKKYRVVYPMLGRFSNLPYLAGKLNLSYESVDGILFDLGCSSMQMDQASRGFALSKDGILDMRMDSTRTNGQPTALDIVSLLDEDTLFKIIKIYGEEKHARRIARALVECRYTFRTPRTTKELAQVVASVFETEHRFDKLNRASHIATKTFQALRIFANNELNELNYGLEQAFKFLRPGGRLVAISFHSLEDRIVKRQIMGVDMDEAITSSVAQKYRNAAKVCTENELAAVYKNRWTAVNKSVITPNEDEITRNPRSRSAKLRCAIRKSV